jgi:hypothetical protein
MYKEWQVVVEFDNGTSIYTRTDIEEKARETYLKMCVEHQDATIRISSRAVLDWMLDTARTPGGGICRFAEPFAS